LRQRNFYPTNIVVYSAVNIHFHEEKENENGWLEIEKHLTSINDQ